MTFCGISYDSISSAQGCNYITLVAEHGNCDMTMDELREAYPDAQILDPFEYLNSVCYYCSENDKAIKQGYFILLSNNADKCETYPTVPDRANFFFDDKELMLIYRSDLTSISDAPNVDSVTVTFQTGPLAYLQDYGVIVYPIQKECTLEEYVAPY